MSLLAASMIVGAWVSSPSNAFADDYDCNVTMDGCYAQSGSPAAAPTPAAPRLPPVRVVPPKRGPRNSVALMVSGIVVSSLGATLAGVGAFVASQSYVYDRGKSETGDAMRKTSYAFIGIGLGVGVLGIPMIVIGARREPVGAVSLAPTGVAFSGSF